MLMGYKTISLTEEAYKRLLERKIGNESFSDVIYRLTNNTSLRDFVGIVEVELVDQLESNIRAIRKDRTSQFLENLQEDWS